MAKTQLQLNLENQPPVDKEKLAQLDTFVDGLPTTKGALVEILHEAQKLFGYLPRDVQLHVARKLGIPGADVFGVASFYSYFNMKPQGLHTVSVCMGTACFVRGAGKIAQQFKDCLGIEAGETTDDGRFTLKDIRCVGACGLAPVVLVDDKVFGRVQVEDVEHILKTYEEVPNGN